MRVDRSSSLPNACRTHTFIGPSMESRQLEPWYPFSKLWAFTALSDCPLLSMYSNLYCPFWSTFNNTYRADFVKRNSITIPSPTWSCPLPAGHLDPNYPPLSQDHDAKSLAWLQFHFYRWMIDTTRSCPHSLIPCTNVGDTSRSIERWQKTLFQCRAQNNAIAFHHGIRN